MFVMAVSLRKCGCTCTNESAPAELERTYQSNQALFRVGAGAPPGATAELGITTEQSAAHPPGPHCPISLDHHLLRSTTSACRPPLRYTLPSRLLMPHPTALTPVRVLALFPFTTVALDLCRSLQLAVKFLDLCLVIPRFCLSRCVQFDVPRVYIACARCRSCALERRDILVDFTVQPQ